MADEVVDAPAVATPAVVADPAVSAAVADPAVAAVDPAAPPAVDPAAAVVADPVANPADPDKPAVEAQLAEVDKKADEDWRAGLISSLPPEWQEKAKPFLERRASMVEVMRSALTADSKISELSDAMAKMAKIPGKDSTAEEIAAYHKAIGVPDKAEDYRLPAEKDNPFDATANPVVQQWAKDSGLTQAQLDSGLELISKLVDMQQNEFAISAQKAGAATADALRIEWGVKDYAPRINQINKYVGEEWGKFMPAEDAKQLLSKRFSDGTALGEFKPFVQWLDSLASGWGDAGGMIGDGPSQGVDLAARERELMGLMVTDSKRYSSPEVQNELLAIQRAHNRRKAG